MKKASRALAVAVLLAGGALLATLVPCVKMPQFDAQRRGLGLAAALGHRLGEVGEEHGEPQPQRHARTGNDEQHHQHMVEDFHRAHQTHLTMYGLDKLLHRRFGISCLTSSVGKQLDGSNIGIGIGNPSGHD